jgi:hypothetical protein
MANPPKRIGDLIKRTIKYGRTVVRIQVGHSRDDHTILEDQLCSNSTFFRSKLQPTRKPIEGICSICHDVLAPGIKELTFCSKQCGINLHYTSMQEYIDKRGALPIICPHCRAPWPTDTNIIKVHRFPELAPTAFEIYMHWILDTAS